MYSADLLPRRRRDERRIICCFPNEGEGEDGFVSIRDVPCDLGITVDNV
jgi:hypothetical protein